MIIEKLLVEDWEPGVDGGKGRQVPPIVHEDDCVVRFKCVIKYVLILIFRQDCFQWEYGDFKN